MAQVLWDGFFTHYGFQAVYLMTKVKISRAGSSKYYVILVVSKKIHMTPYHPQGNRQFE